MADVSNLELMRRAAEKLGEGSEEGRRLAKIKQALGQVEWFEEIDGRRAQDDLHAPARRDLSELLPVLASKYGGVPEVKQLLERYTLKVRDVCSGVGWPPRTWTCSFEGFDRLDPDPSRAIILEAGAPRALPGIVQLAVVDEGRTFRASVPVDDADVRLGLAKALSGAKGMNLEAAGDLSFFVVRDDAEVDQRR